MEPTNNSSFNADELEAPSWLNTQFFTEILSKYENAAELRVNEFKLSPASAKGDHYASVMFRSNVSYTTAKGNFSKSLIIKTMPELEGHKKEILGETQIFPTEIGMYTKVLPEFERILSEASDNTKLCVPCIYHSLQPREVMIFEDLVPEGYTIIRGREANIEELKLAYSKLAKWQAVSFHLLHEQPDYLQEFKYGVCEMPNLLNDPIMRTGMRFFIDSIKKLPELSKYVPFFEKLENDYLDRFVEVMQEYRKNRQPNGYYVLCHGDFHLRNIMFKYNKSNGSLEDCMLIDFQMSNLSPISIDLIYSIYMLLGHEDRRDNYKELIDYYFSEFVETLKRIGFKGELPNLEEFWRQIHNHKDYEIFGLTILLPMIMGLKTNEYDPAVIFTNKDVREKLYYLESFLEDIKYLLPRFEKLGYFEQYK